MFGPRGWKLNHQVHLAAARTHHSLPTITNMPEYRRIEAQGATVFFTVVTHRRRPFLANDDSARLLRRSFTAVKRKHPFELDAIVILPDHMHTIWTLPPHDPDFSIRWSLLKRDTDSFLETGGQEADRPASRRKRRERGVWQRRFWDHVIRDEEDLGRHLDYIHYNPVKHRHVQCPHAWPYSSFHRWVERGIYASDWMCVCSGRSVRPPDFRNIERFARE